MIPPRPRFCTVRRRVFAHAAALLAARVVRRFPPGRRVMPTVPAGDLVRA